MEGVESSVIFSTVIKAHAVFIKQRIKVHGPLLSDYADIKTIDQNLDIHNLSTIYICSVRLVVFN